MDILKRFSASLEPQDQVVLQDVSLFFEWQGEPGKDEFIPDATDDVALRSFLLDQRIQDVDYMTLTRIVSSLERFYAWLKTKELISENPFEKYKFKQQFLASIAGAKPREIRHRQDTFLGSPEKREIARLHALNRLAELTNGLPDTESMIQATLDTLLGVLTLNTAWASLWVKSGLLSQNRKLIGTNPPPPHGFVLGAARNLPPSLEESNRYYLRRPPECHCQTLFRTGRLKHAVNVVECDRLRAAAEAGGTNNGLLFHASVPIFSGDEAIGIMNFATDNWQLLSAADLQLLTTGAELLRSALQRAHLYDLSQEQRALLEEELEVARKVQVSLLPAKLPKITGFSLASFWQPAYKISGDYYGIFKLPNRRWGLVIADVCGKGASAALYMAMTYSLIRERVEKELSPAALLAQVNQILYQQFPEMNFVTAFYAVLDSRTHNLTYANAGHNPPLIRKAVEDRPTPVVEGLFHGGIALGVLPEVEYEDRTISMAPGNSLLIFTDGVTEAFNPQGEMYDPQRLKAAFGAAPASADPLINYLKNDLSNWIGETSQADDITMIAFTREQ